MSSFLITFVTVLLFTKLRNGADCTLSSFLRTNLSETTLLLYVTLPHGCNLCAIQDSA